MQKKIITLQLVSLLLLWQQAGSQVYSLTKTVIEDTKNSRKKQKVDTLDAAWLENGRLIINFVATLDNKHKKQRYHIILPIDSVLSDFRFEDQYRMTIYDSATAFTYHTGSAARSYHQIFRYGSNQSRGIEVMCLDEIIVPGFHTFYPGTNIVEQITILPATQKEYLHKLYGKEYTYLTGKHIVFLYFPKKAFLVNGTSIDYLVLNIENNRQPNKFNYLKLPFAAILDTAMLPFVLMMRGMQK